MREKNMLEDSKFRKMRFTPLGNVLTAMKTMKDKPKKKNTIGGLP